MVARLRLLVVAVIGALLLALLIVPAAEARTKKVAKVTGVTAGASNTTTAKIAIRWKKVSGATYQVRFASSAKNLTKARAAAVRTNSAVSPPLSNICATWYAQVRAKKGARYGAWSTPKALKFKIPYAKVPTPVVSGQTSTTQVQVRWTRSPGAAGYRMNWSPAPFGYFPQGSKPTNNYTAYVAPTTTGTSLKLPTKAAAGDHYLSPAYGNPVFLKLGIKRCDGSTSDSSPYKAVFPKAPAPGSSSTGSQIMFGSYNLELAPDSTSAPQKMINIAANISSNQLDVVALQEATSQTADDLIVQLAADGQTDWNSCVKGQQAVIYRMTRWIPPSAGACVDVGMPVDGTSKEPSDAAKTPLPTPGVMLAPAAADPKRRDVFVVSVHLEDRKKFDAAATIPQQKKDAHDAAQALIEAIKLANPDGDGVPTLVAGDLKGNFGGSSTVSGAGYCDETTPTRCEGEGQPTFIRNGYLDARSAVNKVNIEYDTVSGHDATPDVARSLIGSRADFIVVRGFSGVDTYDNVVRTFDNAPPPALPAGPENQPDHNLIWAKLFIPFQ